MARTEAQQKKLRDKIYGSWHWDNLDADYRTTVGDHDFSGSVQTRTGYSVSIFGDLTTSGSAKFRYGVSVQTLTNPTGPNIGDTMYSFQSGSLCFCTGYSGNHPIWQEIRPIEG